LVWEALERPIAIGRTEEPGGGGAIYPLPGGVLSVHFRTRRTQARAPAPSRFATADAPWRPHGDRRR
jgi:hypothetical protein